jgi:hypothetical protein
LPGSERQLPRKSKGRNVSVITLRQPQLLGDLNKLARAQSFNDRFKEGKAFDLSVLLKAIRQDGKEKTMQNKPKSSFYRNVRELRALGLLN